VARVGSGGVGGDRGYRRALELRKDEGYSTEVEWRRGDGPKGALHGGAELDAGAALGVAWKGVEETMAGDESLGIWWREVARA